VKNTVGLCAGNVRCLKAFRPFQQIELDSLTFIQSPVTVLLNRGEMYEYILSGGALDETISFSPVEPLHYTLLSHKNSFRLCLN
jgi:hypothetical protein